MKAPLLQIWHYLNYGGLFYLGVNPKENASFGRSWRLLKLCGVVTCYNWTSDDVVRVSPVFRYVLTILHGNILDKCNESSLTGVYITVCPY